MPLLLLVHATLLPVLLVAVRTSLPSLLVPLNGVHANRLIASVLLAAALLGLPVAFLRDVVLRPALLAVPLG